MTIHQNPLIFFRDEISKIDDEIIRLLVKRCDYSFVIGKYKKENNIPICNHQIKNNINNKYFNDLGVFGESIYDLIHDYSISIQKNESNYLQVRGCKNSGTKETI